MTGGNGARILMLCVNNFRFLTPAHNEMESLGRRGYSVEVITLRNRGEEATEVFRTAKVRRMALLTRGLPKRPFFWLIKYFEFLIRLFVREMFVNRPAQVYVAHNFETLFPSVVLSRLRATKCLYRAHELTGEIKGAPMARLIRWLEEVLLRFPDAVVTPNEPRARILTEEYKCQRVPVVVMNCPHYRTPTIRRSAEVLQLRRDADVRIAIFQGRLGADRCIPELVEAARYISHHSLLLLIGPIDTGLREDLDTIIMKYDLHSRVAILPPVSQDQLKDYTDSADAGVVFYRNTDRNNFFCAPNKVFEYFMAGLPVIASNSPILVSLVKATNAGLIVDAENPASIGRAVEELLHDTPRLLTMRTNALKNAKTFNWETQEEKLMEVYRELGGRG